LFIILSKKQVFAEEEVLLRANARSAVRVFTGEAGEAFALFFAVFALKPAAFLKNREEQKVHN